jgi:hypothetical protein
MLINTMHYTKTKSISVTVQQYTRTLQFSNHYLILASNLGNSSTEGYILQVNQHPFKKVPVRESRTCGPEYCLSGSGRQEIHSILDKLRQLPLYLLMLSQSLIKTPSHGMSTANTHYYSTVGRYVFRAPPSATERHRAALWLSHVAAPTSPYIRDTVILLQKAFQPSHQAAVQSL